MSARHVAIALALLLPASLHAQRPARSATATLAVTAQVLPVLVIDAIETSADIAGSDTAGVGADGGPVTGDAAPVWDNRVVVRANVPHQVLVRPPAGGTVALRSAGGRWVAASSAAPLDLRGAPGEAAHEVECRGTTEACALTFELRSSDPRYPMRVTGVVHRASRVAAVASIATTT